MAEIRAARKLEEVARLAGVSVSTVSRTLAGKAHVSEKARKKVLEAADKLDYRPNVMARMLKLGRSSSIAVMIPSIDNLIYPAFVRGVQDVASQNGYMLSICNTDEDKDIEENFIRSSCNMGVAGLIVSTIRSDSGHLTKLRDEGFPIVLAIRELDGKFDTIVAGNCQGAYDMTSYLLGKGCRHIVLVAGDLGLSLYRQRHDKGRGKEQLCGGQKICRAAVGRGLRLDDRAQHIPPGVYRRRGGFRGQHTQRVQQRNFSRRRAGKSAGRYLYEDRGHNGADIRQISGNRYHHARPAGQGTRRSAARAEYGSVESVSRKSVF